MCRSKSKQKQGEGQANAENRVKIRSKCMQSSTNPTIAEKGSKIGQWEVVRGK